MGQIAGWPSQLRIHYLFAFTQAQLLADCVPLTCTAARQRVGSAMCIRQPCLLTTRSHMQWLALCVKAPVFCRCISAKSLCLSNPRCTAVTSGVVC